MPWVCYDSVQRKEPLLADRPQQAQPPANPRTTPEYVMAMLATQRWFPWLCLGLLSLCATGCPSPMASQPASPPTSPPLRPAPAPSEVPPHLPDLGDVAQGTYMGDVIADSHGASKSHVTVTVTRIGSNLVRMTSDYARLPTVAVPLPSAMDKFVQ